MPPLHTTIKGIGDNQKHKAEAMVILEEAATMVILAEEMGTMDEEEATITTHPNNTPLICNKLLLTNVIPNMVALAHQISSLGIMQLFTI